MSYDQSYPFPQVFVVDGGGQTQHPAQPPGLIPCWSYPPAQERGKARGKSKGGVGANLGRALVVLMLFLLTFAALGFEAYQIFNLQKELRALREKEVKPATEVLSPQKQVGFWEAEENEGDDGDRPAAHVIGRTESNSYRNTLRWEPKVGQAFTTKGVTYQDGALQVNEAGLYHIYSRVEVLLEDCSSATPFGHSIYVEGEHNSVPLTLMRAERVGLCFQKNSGRSWTMDSYLGSIHRLKKNDQVYVNISHPAYLSHSHDGNFFGLYKI